METTIMGYIGFRVLMVRNSVLYIYIYWGYMGIMEKKMETTIMGYIGILSPNNGESNGKENGK